MAEVFVLAKLILFNRGGRFMVSDLKDSFLRAGEFGKWKQALIDRLRVNVVPDISASSFLP